MTKRPKPLAILRTLHSRLDKSGFTECQVIADLIGDHIDNEIAAHGKALPDSSLAGLSAMFDEILLHTREARKQLHIAARLPCPVDTYTLHCAYGDGADIQAHVSVEPTGIDIGFTGYTTAGAPDDEGQPVYIENTSGLPRVIVWGDVFDEDPTHTIHLEGAANATRKNY